MLPRRTKKSLLFLVLLLANEATVKNYSTLSIFENRITSSLLYPAPVIGPASAFLLRRGKKSKKAGKNEKKKLKKELKSQLFGAVEYREKAAQLSRWLTRSQTVGIKILDEVVWKFLHESPDQGANNGAEAKEFMKITSFFYIGTQKKCIFFKKINNYTFYTENQ